MAGAFANGLIISFIPAILLVLMGDIGFTGTTFGDSDFGNEHLLNKSHSKIKRFWNGSLHAV